MKHPTSIERLVLSLVARFEGLQIEELKAYYGDLVSSPEDQLALLLASGHPRPFLASKDPMYRDLRHVNRAFLDAFGDALWYWVDRGRVGFGARWEVYRHK